MYLSPLSLQPRSLSLFRYVNHPRLFISLIDSLSSATLIHFTLFCFGCNLSVFLSPSLSFFPKLTVNFQTCTLSLSLFLMISGFSPCSHAHLLYFFSRSLSFSISLPSSLSLFLSLSLSSAMLTHFTIFCCGRHLPPFSHSPFLSFLLSLFSYVNRHSSDTYTTPIYLSLSRCLSLPPFFPPSLPPSLSFINFP